MPVVDRGLSFARKPLFEGKVALIVGASRGIGAATAMLLARSGAKIMLAARGAPALEAFSAQLNQEGATAGAMVADAGDADSLSRLVDHTVATFGRLDIAVNNAGVALPQARISETNLDDYDQLMQVNARGVFAAMKYELSAMVRGGGGSIVNVSSIGGIIGSTGRASYVTSKHALGGMTKCAALEYAKDGVRVNAVAPGSTLTDLVKPGLEANPELYEKVIAAVPMNRPAQPEEIAQAIAWLASDLASYVTGVVLPVDGGFTVP
jgi:A-factor type gamma-butyrolactone 1'-reductase (1S-forming)